MELCLFVQITAELIPIDQKLDKGESMFLHDFFPLVLY